MDLQYRSLVLPALLAAATLVLAGCTGDDPAAKDPETDLPTGPISQQMADLEERYASDAATAVSIAIDESVAACMEDQGFDYTPSYDGSTQAAHTPGWGSQEYATTYGYGITTRPDVPGAAPTEAGAPASAPTLDDAYLEALQGSDPGGDDAGAWLPGGCYGEAMADADVMALLTSPVAQDIDNLTAQADQDEAVIAALDGWATCMADKGYAYETSEDAQRSIQERAYPADGEALTGSALEALQGEEIATAVADYQCSIDQEQAWAAALARLETAYYADHKTEVDAYFVQVEEFLARG